MNLELQKSIIRTADIDAFQIFLKNGGKVREGRFTKECIEYDSKKNFFLNLLFLQRKKIVLFLWSCSKLSRFASKEKKDSSLAVVFKNCCSGEDVGLNGIFTFNH